MGIGTTNPSTTLEISGSGIPQVRITDTDAAGSGIIIGDAGGGASVFWPMFRAFPIGTNRYSWFISELKSGEDTGTHPATVFTSRYNGANDITTRPLFEWRNNSTPHMTMIVGGNVGIGTTNPLAPIHISSEASSTAAIFDYYVSGATSPGLLFRKARGAASAPSGVLNGDYLGNFGVRAYGTTGFSVTQRATIGMRATEDWTDTTTGTTITLETTANGTQSRTERMRIDHNGNVGIGTTTPGSPFQISLAATDSPTSLKGILSEINVTSTTGSVAASMFAIEGKIIPNVSAGATHSGNLYGVLGRGYATTGMGSIEDMAGLRAEHGNRTGAGVTINNSYGLWTKAFFQAGVTTNSYGVFLDSPSTGGTISNEFGIYQKSTSAKNFLAGNLGIGTPMPGATLDVYSGTAADGSTPTTLRITGSRNSNSWSTGVPLMNLDFYNDDATAGGANVRTRISTMTENLTGSNWSMAFSTATLNAAPTERMRIDSSGNVGIGTMSPGVKLDVSSGTLTSLNEVINGRFAYNTGKGVGLGYYGDVAGTNVAEGRVRALSNTNLAFGTSNYPQAIYITDASGNVGIGTTSPVHMLDIRKDITGATNTYGLNVKGTGLSDVTGNLGGVITQIGTTSANYNVANLVHFQANQAPLENINAGGQLTKQIGFQASSNLIGASTNWGVSSQIPFGAGRWNFYAGGTADNYFAGSVGIGTTMPGSVPNWTPASSQRILEVSGDGSPSATANGVLVMSNNRATSAVNDALGTITFSSTNSPYGRNAAIHSTLEGSGGANGFGANLRFYTRADNSAAS